LNNIGEKLSGRYTIRWFDRNCLFLSLVIYTLFCTPSLIFLYY